MKKKKILFIIPWVPYPLTSGGNQAFFHMVDYLRQKMDVSLLCYAAWEGEARKAPLLQEVWKDVTFYVYEKKAPAAPEPPQVKNPTYFKWLQKMKASVERKMRRQILPALPEEKTLNGAELVRNSSVLYSSVFKGFDSEYVAYVAEVAAQGFDVIQVEFYELLALGYVLPKDVETIFVHHELRYVRNENEMGLFAQCTPEDRMYFQVAKDFEQEALKAYKHVIALTEVDKRLLEKLLGRTDRIYASPAVVQMNANQTYAFVPGQEHRFTFVGYGEHFPNLDAVVWFAEKIAPLLRAQHFPFKFQVVGMGYDPVAADLQKLCPELELLGYVKELEPVLRGSISVVPIRIGSGMRMKILDMVCMGIPFITTSKGLEGISLQHEKDCWIADTAEDFARTLMHVAVHPEEQEQCTAHAHAQLAHLYNPAEMLERRWNIYSSLLS